MRFLANENFPGDAVTQWKATGHDIVWVHTAAPGMKDEDVLAWAAREARVVLTFDKDFGELAWRAGLPASSGIVLLRLPMPPVAEVGTTLAARIVERTDLAGHFTVIEPARIRMRPLGNPGVRLNDPFDGALDAKNLSGLGVATCPCNPGAVPGSAVLSPDN
jgi:predicted nuclease of predicted toxin-antitoxin system